MEYLLISLFGIILFFIGFILGKNSAFKKIVEWSMMAKSQDENHQFNIIYDNKKIYLEVKKITLEDAE